MRNPPLLLLGLLLGALATAAPAAAVSVSPQPGTPTASSKTQLSFRGAAPAGLGTIRVRGSRSGVHGGRLRPHSDGQGASLVFPRPFRRGESVLVRTSLGIPGARDGDYRFRVAGQGNASAIVLGIQPPSRVGAGTRDRFASRPDLAPPAITILRRSGALAPGLLLLNARNATGRGQQGPMIVDDRGELVFFRPVGRRRRATDFRMQTYRGTPVLTYWVGLARQGAGSGENVIVGPDYRTIARVRAGNGYRSDLHEFRLTAQDTALVTIYNPISRDLSSLGGSSRGKVVDSIVQEIDIPTGLVRFEWHSIGQVVLAESYERPSRNANLSYDYFHVNSVSADADGDLLVSARGTWAVYKVDRETGQILWRLNGRRSDFAMGPGTRFAYQHDAEREADGTLSLFDNSAAPPVRKRSRAIFLALDEAAKTARLVTAYTHPAGLLAANQASLQRLPNGNLFIGWGSQRAFSEHAPDGGLLLDGRIARGNDSYRAYRASWTGRPRGRPRLAAQARPNGRTAVFASYNGATEVASWEILVGPGPRRLAPVATAPRAGYETGVRVMSAGRYFAVRALDGAGGVLGSSRAVRRR